MSNKMPANKVLPDKVLPNQILIVDDDPGYLALLKHRLGKAGFDVLSADGGEAAKVAFSESPVSIVVSDLVMPKVNGVALLKFVKEEKPETEVILLSGKGSIEQAVEAMRLGAFDFLVKPVADGRLESLVAYCFETIIRKNQREKGQEKVSEMLSNQDIPAPGLEKTFAEFSMTPSEIGVIGLLLKGKTNREIADARFVSPHTAKKHLQNIFKKMKVKNRIELILQLK